MEAAGTLLKITTSGLESYIFDVIQQRLGHYIQNLTREQLNVSGWAGEGVLEQVSIRVDALRSMSLPFRVRSGHAARIRVRIPWHALRSESVTIIIEDLTLQVEHVAGSHSDSPQNKPTAASASPTVADSQDNAGSSGSYFARIASALVHNVCFHVSNLRVKLLGHVDNERTIGQAEFTACLGVDHLTVRAANDDWQPGFHWPEPNINRRRLEVSGMWVSFRRPCACPAPTAGPS